MAATFKAGDKVTWRSSQGEVKGVVDKKVTSPMTIKSHRVEASPDHPQYLVTSDETGAKAAHRPDALTKRQ